MQSVGAAGTTSVQTAIRKNTNTSALRTNPTTTGTGFHQFQGYAASGAYAVLAASDVFVGFWFIPNGLPSTLNETFFCWYSSVSSVRKAELRCDSTGKIAIYNGTTQIAIGATVLVAGKAYFIEARAGTGAASTYEVKINGVQEFTGTTTLSSDNTTDVLFGKHIDRNGKGVDWVFQDMYIDDAAYRSEREWIALKPAAAGATAQWSTGTSALFSAVNDLPNDGDTTYIGSSTNTQSSSFSMDPIAGKVAGLVQSVIAVAIMRDLTGTASVKVRLKSGATNSDTTGATMSTAYTTYGKLFETDPNTSAAWTMAAVGLIEGGVVQNSAIAARCTAIYAFVGCAFATQEQFPIIHLPPARRAMPPRAFLAPYWTDPLETPHATTDDGSAPPLAPPSLRPVARRFLPPAVLDLNQVAVDPPLVAPIRPLAPPSLRPVARRFLPPAVLDLNQVAVDPPLVAPIRSRNVARMVLAPRWTDPLDTLHATTDDGSVPRLSPPQSRPLARSFLAPGVLDLSQLAAVVDDGTIAILLSPRAIAWARILCGHLRVDFEPFPGPQNDPPLIAPPRARNVPRKFLAPQPTPPIETLHATTDDGSSPRLAPPRVRFIVWPRRIILPPGAFDLSIHPIFPNVMPNDGTADWALLHDGAAAFPNTQNNGSPEFVMLLNGAAVLVSFGGGSASLDAPRGGSADSPRPGGS